MILPSIKAGYSKFGKSFVSEQTIDQIGSQDYTVPAGATHLSIEMRGGGGPGWQGTTRAGINRGGGGGGGGAFTYIVLTEDFKKEDIINFTIGDAGVAGSNAQDTTLNNYKRGGSTLITYTGKSAGGGGRADNNSGGAGGITSGGISPSVNGNSGSNGQSGTGGCRAGGEGGGSGYSIFAGGAGGSCPNGGSGGSPFSSGGGGGGGSYGGNIIVAGNAGIGLKGSVRITAYSHIPPTPLVQGELPGGGGL